MYKIYTMHTSSRPRLLNVFTNKGTKFKLQNITDLELGMESESESVSGIACEQYMVTDKDCTGCTNVHNTI